MSRPALSAEDRAMLDGSRGEAPRQAMRIVAAMAEVMGADRLIDISGAHVDGCLYHGQASLDFAGRLVDAGARVRVPTTLNVGLVDLLHPGRYRSDPELVAAGRRLMDLYVAMGCRATWTCAPYQLPHRPAFGEHVAWAESNAVVFANSVLGARTDRYGDFIDVCAAITGRVGESGLHVEQNRRGRILVRTGAIAERLKDEDVFYPVLGHLIGREADSAVPVIEGLPPGTGEDRLKALGAAAASAGAVGMFHAVGITPEAPTVQAALHGAPPEETLDVSPAMLIRARDDLSTSIHTDLGAVSIGTPHLSLAEFAGLVPLLGGDQVHPSIDLFVSTSRDVLAQADRRGWRRAIEAAGAQIVVDTCTYLAPLLPARPGAVMTNSAKWAYYAPGNIGATVVFGSLRECVRSAVTGRLWRDPHLWAAIGTGG